MITYSIALQFEDRDSEEIPLRAKTDTAAIAQLRKWLATAKIEDGCHVYLVFNRDTDGQVGYINPMGASPTGKPWNLPF